MQTIFACSISIFISLPNRRSSILLHEIMDLFQMFLGTKAYSFTSFRLSVLLFFTQKSIFVSIFVFFVWFICLIIVILRLLCNFLFYFVYLCCYCPYTPSTCNGLLFLAQVNTNDHTRPKRNIFVFDSTLITYNLWKSKTKNSSK